MFNILSNYKYVLINYKKSENSSQLKNILKGDRFIYVN